MHIGILFLLVFVATGCVNPLNRATAIRYSIQCREKELAGQLEVAETCCYRAVKNTQWGFLSKRAQSEALFNLARIKRKLGKTEEAMKVLKSSIEYEEKLKPVDVLELGGRWAEMSLCLYMEGRIVEAEPYLQKLISIADKYTDERRAALGGLFRLFIDNEKKRLSPRLFTDLAAATAMITGSK